MYIVKDNGCVYHNIGIQLDLIVKRSTAWMEIHINSYQIIFYTYMLNTIE